MTGGGRGLGLGLGAGEYVGAVDRREVEHISVLQASVGQRARARGGQREAARAVAVQREAERRQPQRLPHALVQLGRRVAGQRLDARRALRRLHPQRLQTQRSPAALNNTAPLVSAERWRLSVKIVLQANGRDVEVNDCLNREAIRRDEIN